MAGLAMYKECSPAVIHSLGITGIKCDPCVAPVTSLGFHQGWSCLQPPRSSRLGFDPACAPVGFTAGWRTWSLPRDKEDGQDEVSHHSCSRNAPVPG